MSIGIHQELHFESRAYAETAEESEKERKKERERMKNGDGNDQFHTTGTQ